MGATLKWKKSGYYHSAIGQVHGNVPARMFSICTIGGYCSSFMYASNLYSLGWSPTLEIAKKNCQNIENFYVVLELPQ